MKILIISELYLHDIIVGGIGTYIFPSILNWMRSFIKYLYKTCLYYRIIKYKIIKL